ncbi:hypothetical protein Tco_1248686 [Tanacetum coccineum]
MMDDSNITMEEYIRLEEEKAQKHGKVFNWETTKYGKIWYDEDIHNLRSVETEFPAIAFNDEVSSEKTFSCEPTVSSLNHEIDFKVSFDDSDDEDYMVIFDKSSFSYKKISTNDLKKDSENDNENVNLPSLISPKPTVSCFDPSLPSPKPTVNCFDDLDFFKDFENEFPAIVYNDAQMSKSDLLTGSILSPQHIDEFDLNDETSVSEYDEEEQNVLYFNNLFPFNLIHPDDLKSKKENDGNEIDIIQSLGGNEITQGSKMLFETSHDKITKTFRTGSFVMNSNVNIVIWNYYGILFCLIMNLYVPFGIPFDPKRYYKDGVYTRMLRRPRAIRHMALPPCDQRHQYLRVQVFDFGGLLDLMADGLSARMLMEHKDAQGVSLFTSQAGRRLFDIRGQLVHELILEFFSKFRFGEAILDLDTLGALHFQLGGARRRMSWREFILALGLYTAEEMQTVEFDFLGTALSYTTIRDLILRLCHRLIACSIVRRSQAPEKVIVTDLFYLRGMDVGSISVPYILARYLRLFTAGRKSMDHIFGGQFIARLAEHFGLLTVEIPQGLTVIAPALSVIDMTELVRFQICMEINDTWAWVAMGPERQPDAVVGAFEAAEDAHVVDEGGQRLRRLEEEVKGLRRDVEGLRGLVERSMTDQGRFSTWMISYMAQLMEGSGLTYHAFDGTFRGSSPIEF